MQFLLALVDAMCEIPAATSSDTDEEELHQNIFSAFLDMFTSFQAGRQTGSVLDRRRNWASGTELPLRT